MTISIDRAAFFAGYRSAFGRLTQAQVVGLETTLGFIEADPLPDRRWIAYYLATKKHECADTWMPIEERGKLSYFEKYEPSTKLGAALGNTVHGDGHLYCGRGDVQLTGRANYQRMGDLLGIDLVGNPDLALVPLNAYRIACVGMAKGLFTGRKFSDYFNAQTTDWVKARRIVNGNDKAKMIAGYAESFFGILNASVREALPLQAPGVPPPAGHDKLVLAVRAAIADLQRAIGE